MNIKLNGGSTDLHMIALVDMKKLAESIQKISYNYGYIYIKVQNAPRFLNMA